MFAERLLGNVALGGLILVVTSLGKKLQINNRTTDFNSPMNIDFEKLKDLLPSIAHFISFYDNYDDKSTLYIVTPTYRRYTQMADLIVMRNTLVLVPKLVWILIEDSLNKTRRIEEFLELSKLRYVHLAVTTPNKTEKVGNLTKISRSRLKGAEQRNAAIKWLRDNQSKIKNGVVYFADDDNKYDLRLFEDIRTTKEISMFPVGFAGGIMYEGPICKKNKVIGFLTTFKRKYSIDMAGFALNLKRLFKYPAAKFDSTPGYQESHFLQMVNATTNILEPKADSCSKVLVWHTKTSASHGILKEDKLKLKNIVYNEKILETV